LIDIIPLMGCGIEAESPQWAKWTRTRRWSGRLAAYSPYCSWCLY